MTDIRMPAGANAPAATAGTVAIGDGELVANRMGFGAMRITGRGIFGPPADPHEAKRVLRRAVKLGVNFIDTADSYGPHVSEELIAEALHPYPEGLVIATKGGFERPGPDKWKTNGRPDYLRSQLERSLRRLKLERIDLWQLHRIDKKVPADEQFGVLADFVREGKVRYVGLSEVGVDDVERARRVVPIVSVQNRYNVLDREWEDVVAYCDRESIVFIPWYPLALIPRYPLGAGALTNEQDEGRARIERVAARHEASALQIALAWLLARSPMMLVIPGTSKVEHLEENVAAAALTLSELDLHELDGRSAGGRRG